jgi:hypothetical protein
MNEGGGYQHVRSFYQRLIFEARKKSNCLAFHKWFLCTFWQQKVTEKIKRLLSLSQQSTFQETLLRNIAAALSCHDYRGTSVKNTHRGIRR